MATKAVIEIPVDDAAFRKFVDLFNSYTAKLDDQPEKWAEINKEMSGAGDALREGAISGRDALALAAAQAELIGAHLRDAIKAQTELGGSRGWAGFTKSGTKAAQSVGKALSGAVGASIGEMGAGIAGVAAGALGALGPVGLAVGAIAAVVGGAGAALKGLADAAVSRQRSAFSQGITPGQEASFQINAQQFMGPGALAAAANAQTNLGNAGPLSLLGIDFSKARGMDAGALAFQMLSGATSAASASSLPLENIPAVQAYLALGGNLGDVRNALKMGPGALQQAALDTANHAGRLDLNGNAVAEAAKLKKGAETAGVMKQSGFINNSAGAFSAAAGVLSVVNGDTTPTAALKTMGDVIDQHAVPAIQKFDHALNLASGGVLGRIRSWIAADPVGQALGIRSAQTVVAVAKKKGVDPALALAAAIQESGLNPNIHAMDHYADGSPAGYSSGLFQLNEHGEGAGMSLKDLLDPTKNSSVALAQFAKIAKAHPNWSPGQIAAEAQGPANKAAYAKSVDAIYQSLLKAQRASRSSSPNVNVNVTNSTASNVAASVNAGAQQ